MKLIVTDTLKTELRRGWTDEATEMEWDAAELARLLNALDVTPTGTEIPISDDDDIDETTATPEQLITLGVDFFGFGPNVVTYTD